MRFYGVVVEVAGVFVVGNVAIDMDVCGVVLDVPGDVVTMQFASPLTHVASNSLLGSRAVRCIADGCGIGNSPLVHDVGPCFY